MNIPQDKKLHLIGGCLFAVFMVATLLVALFFGPGWAVVFSGILMGWGLERYQAIRHEGTPEKLDWVASSTPAVVAGLAIQGLWEFTDIQDRLLGWLL